MKLSEKLKEVWPSWLPYFSAWIRAVVSASFLIPLLLSSAFYDPSNPNSEDTSTAVLLVLSSLYGLFYAVLNHKFTGGKGWTPALCLWKANYSMAVTVIAMIPASISGMAFTKEVYYYGQRQIDVSKDALFVAIGTYLVIAAFLFHWENLLGLWINKIKNKRRKKQAIEKEFSDLKKEALQERERKIKGLKRKNWLSYNKKRK